MNQAQTTSTERTKNLLKQQQTAQGATISPAPVVSQEGRAKNAHAWLLSLQPQLERALPQHLKADRLIRLALTTLRRNPQLLTCTKESILGAIMQCAQYGLEPGIGNMAHIVPYRNRGVMEAQFQIGYEGYIDLMYRNDRVLSVFGNTIHEKDEFEYSYGMGAKFLHKPATGDRGEVIFYYCQVQLKGADLVYFAMSREDVRRHAEKFSPSFRRPDGFYNQHPDAYGLKTCVRGIQKWIPKSIEMRSALAADESIARVGDDNSLDSVEFEVVSGEGAETKQEEQAQPATAAPTEQGERG